MSRKIILNNSLVFEPEKKRITSNGRQATISASASLCMELLIDNVGQLVTHQQFFDYAWRRFGMEPTSTSLYQNISGLRRALTKSGLKEDIIRTMPRRGFLLSPKTIILRENISPPLSVIVSSEDADSAPSDEPHTNLGESHAEDNLTSVKEESSPDSKCQQFSHPSLFKRRIFFDWFPFGGILALATILALTFYFFYFSYYRVSLSSDGALFIYSTDYKGCTIFNNSNVWLSKYELKKKVDQLNIDCKATPYVYLTAFRYAGSFSYFDCQNPLNTTVSAKCRSYFILKNLNDD